MSVRNCWCSKLCNQCISKAEENGKLSRKMRLSNCQITKIAVEDMMKNYIVLRKHGCRFEEYEKGSVKMERKGTILYPMIWNNIQ